MYSKSEVVLSYCMGSGGGVEREDSAEAGGYASAQACSGITRLDNTFLLRIRHYISIGGTKQVGKAPWEEAVTDLRTRNKSSRLYR